jgi:hypothetical protein
MAKDSLIAVIFDPDGKIVMTVDEVESVKFAAQGTGVQSSTLEIIRGGHQRPVITTLPILVYDPEASGISSPLPGVKRR